MNNETMKENTISIASTDNLSSEEVFMKGQNLLGQYNTMIMEIVDAVQNTKEEYFKPDKVAEVLSKYMTVENVEFTIGDDQLESMEKENWTKAQYFKEIMSKSVRPIVEAAVNKGKFQRIDTEAPEGKNHKITMYMFGSKE